jgi:hypothetical protein
MLYHLSTKRMMSRLKHHIHPIIGTPPPFGGESAGSVRQGMQQRAIQTLAEKTVPAFVVMVDGRQEAA